jgi:hypothetical protein
VLKLVAVTPPNVNSPLHLQLRYVSAKSIFPIVTPARAQQREGGMGEGGGKEGSLPTTLTPCTLNKSTLSQLSSCFTSRMHQKPPSKDPHKSLFSWPHCLICFKVDAVRMQNTLCFNQGYFQRSWLLYNACHLYCTLVCHWVPRQSAASYGLMQCPSTASQSLCIASLSMAH